MERQSYSFEVTDVELFEQKVLIWTKQFSTFCLLDNNDYTLPYQTYNYILAAGAAKVFVPSDDFFESLTTFYNNTTDWIFGHFNYDLKNKIEALTSNNLDHQNFVDSYLFVPETLLFVDGCSVTISAIASNPESIFKEINSLLIDASIPSISVSTTIKARINKERVFDYGRSLTSAYFAG